MLKCIYISDVTLEEVNSILTINVNEDIRLLTYVNTKTIDLNNISSDSKQIIKIVRAWYKLYCIKKFNKDFQEPNVLKLLSNRFIQNGKRQRAEGKISMFVDHFIRGFYRNELHNVKIFNNNVNSNYNNVMSVLEFLRKKFSNIYMPINFRVYHKGQKIFYVPSYVFYSRQMRNCVKFFVNEIKYFMHKVSFLKLIANKMQELFQNNSTTPFFILYRAFCNLVINNTSLSYSILPTRKIIVRRIKRVYKYLFIL